MIRGWFSCGQGLVSIWSGEGLHVVRVGFHVVRDWFLCSPGLVSMLPGWFSCGPGLVSMWSGLVSM